jgi:hypothetical protein
MTTTTDNLDAEMRYWNFYISYPTTKKLTNGTDHAYNANRALGVVAETMEAATDLVKQAYPEASIWSATHRGEVNLSVVTYKESDDENYRSKYGATEAAKP